LFAKFLEKLLQERDAAMFNVQISDNLQGRECVVVVVVVVVVKDKFDFLCESLSAHSYE
jgi:hypothetical protein